jgi:predicted TIM-barrel fold metal-dependent hydrolase
MEPRTDRTEVIDRRSLLKAALLPAAAPLAAALTSRLSQGGEQQGKSDQGFPEIIDTNVHIFDWPFRKLKYADPAALVTKLRQHRIAQAWAGNFEAVLNKQLDAANRRLAAACRAQGDGILLPIGSVNPAWPDWQEDLRRCHEQYRMPGVRLYPAYHGYTLDHPELVNLLADAGKRSLLVQIVLRLEDERVHHAALDVGSVNTTPLAAALQRSPDTKVQLLSAAGTILGNNLPALVRDTKVTFDIAAIEGNGGLGRVIEGKLLGFRAAIPVERLLFGSHAPFFPCESALLKLFESPLELQQLQPLMNGNARRLM